MSETEEYKHKYIQLVEFALANRSFSVQQALDATTMTGDEFDAAKNGLFYLKGMHENPNRNESIDWTLKPEAYFNYLSYQEFKHSVSSSKMAFWLAVTSICIAAFSGVLTGISLFGCGAN